MALTYPIKVGPTLKGPMFIYITDNGESLVEVVVSDEVKREIVEILKKDHDLDQ